MGLKESVATCFYTQKQMWKTANLEKAIEVSMALIVSPCLSFAIKAYVFLKCLFRQRKT